MLYTFSNRSSLFSPSCHDVLPNEPPHDKTNKMTVHQTKTQISLDICPVWSESSLALNGLLRVQTFIMWTAKTLIRLDGCPGWSESLQGTQAILLVLSWGGSSYILANWHWPGIFMIQSTHCLFNLSAWVQYLYPNKCPSPINAFPHPPHPPPYIVGKRK